MKELKQIIGAFERACRNQQKAALATVVHVEGSSYRGPGARMLITEDGMLTGAISGGCLEGDALRKALTVMIEGIPLLATYDTMDEEDAVIGVGLGCNGIIRVLIEPLNPAQVNNPLSLLQQAVQHREACVLVTFFSLDNKWDTQQGTRLLLRENGETLQADDAAGIALNDARNALAAKNPAFIQYGHNNTAFIEYLAPAISLVVAGAGNDVFPVVQAAEMLGWDVTLIDGRPNYASTQRFPSCRLIVKDPASALRLLHPDDRTAVLLMTHNYHYDKALLKALLASPVPYIGMLGPKKKFNRMQSEWEDEGLSLTPEQLSRIYAPLGLDIGAETADEIALAAFAEIKAVFAGKAGGMLRERKGGIHQRKTEIVAASAGGEKHGVQRESEIHQRKTDIAASLNEEKYGTQRAHESETDQLKTGIIAASPGEEKYGIVILAAGTSSRLGQPKQLLPFNGDTLLNNTIKAAKAANVAEIAVVLGAEAPEDLDAPVIFNPEFHEGMASSIRCGVQYMRDQEVDHIILMVCDQPHVDASHIRALIDKRESSGAKIAASFYADRKGVPASFHRSLFSALLALQGDVGARHVIEKYNTDTVVVPFALGAVDIDTAEAYEALIS